MAIIRVTKEFGFEMAHALHNYDGACQNIHGHSYKLFVTVIGEPANDINDPKNGMVIDFGDLKKIVQQEIVNRLDHSLLIYKKSAYKTLQQNKMCSQLEIVDYQPTCENMLTDFAQRIKSKLPEEVKLFSLRLHETANSYAEWFADDNS